MPGTSTEQVVDKGIRQKSTKEWTHSLTAVPFVRGHRSVFPRTPRNTGVYTCHPTFVTATSGVLTRLPEKLSKNIMSVYTLSDRQSEKKLRVYTASEAKGLSKMVMIWWKGTFLEIAVKIANNKGNRLTSILTTWRYNKYLNGRFLWMQICIILV